MTDEEIAVALEGHAHEINSLKHRADDLEEQNKAIQDLALSVKELAINMSNMMEEQRKQGKRLDTLEKEPANRYKQIKTAIITALISGIVGTVIGAVVALL